MKIKNRVARLAAGVMMGLVTVGFTACSPSLYVSTDYDEATNFQQYQTWNWYQDQPVAKSDSTRRYSTFLDKRIKTAVETEMARRGFKKANNADKPDMLLAYDVTIENVQRVRPDYISMPMIGYGYYYGYRYAYRYNRLYDNTTVQNYQEGTIILDVVDANSNELVWRGTSQTTASEKSLTQEKVQEIVNGILAKFPPQTENRATAKR